jgi:hypothetical protein
MPKKILRHSRNQRNNLRLRALQSDEPKKDRSNWELPSRRQSVSRLAYRFPVQDAICRSWPGVVTDFGLPAVGRLAVATPARQPQDLSGANARGKEYPRNTNRR